MLAKGARHECMTVINLKTIDKHEISRHIVRLIERYCAPFSGGGHSTPSEISNLQTRWYAFCLHYDRTRCSVPSGASRIFSFKISPCTNRLSWFSYVISRFRFLFARPVYHTVNHISHKSKIPKIIETQFIIFFFCVARFISRDLEINTLVRIIRM